MTVTPMNAHPLTMSIAGRRSARRDGCIGATVAEGARVRQGTARCASKPRAPSTIRLTGCSKIWVARSRSGVRARVDRRAGGVPCARGAFAGNDSGPSHVAAALGRPGVELFTSTADGDFGPRGSAVRAVPCGHGSGALDAAWERLRTYLTLRPVESHPFTCLIDSFRGAGWGRSTAGHAERSYLL